ncbi:MAG: Gfo/Idh/MocA family oxidoreductase [Kiritimatiellae bacterium]|nr:Gfo/Idh/MocA family oxidoreductase [Kiritimatiellia bacterium]
MKARRILQSTLGAMGLASFALRAEAAEEAPLRLGLIGLDTSHVVAFAKILNDPTASNHLPGARIVAAFKGGSPDISASRDRIEKFTEELTNRWGVVLVPTIEELCRQVDAVILTSVDGRVHLEQARPVIAAGKRLFIDKPMAASLRDGLAIFQLAREKGVPVFSCSSLRYGTNTQAVRKGAVGRVLEAETESPVVIEPTHPELFWYGIHGVESLFTVMGPGCRSVRRRTLEDGRVEVVGTWTDGRKGTFRQSKEQWGYGGRARGERGEQPIGESAGYVPMLREVLKFFRSGVPPVPEEETIEILAFMEAAELSRQRGGDEVELAEVMQRAREELERLAPRR